MSSSHIQKGGGSWGVYDDEGDIVADEWITIEESIIPKCLSDISDKIGSDYAAFNALRKSYVVNNPKRTYEVVKKYMTKYEKDLKKDNGENYEHHLMLISGVSVRAARVMNELIYSDPLGSGIFNSLIPQALPTGYPNWLKKAGLDATKKLLKIADENRLGWMNIRNRKLALNHQLFLFSNGKEGIEGKHSKSNDSSIKRKGSKRKSSSKRKRSKKRFSSKKRSRRTSKKR